MSEMFDVDIDEVHKDNRDPMVQQSHLRTIINALTFLITNDN